MAIKKVCRKNRGAASAPRCVARDAEAVGAANGAETLAVLGSRYIAIGVDKRAVLVLRVEKEPLIKATQKRCKMALA